MSSIRTGHTTTRLDKLEQAAKIFATTAIPIVIAIGGWVLQSTIENDKQQAAKVQATQQNALEKDKISLEYVKIAKDILTSTQKEIPTELTTWSWRLLDGVSPVKFDKGALDRLIARGERIPPPTTPSATSDYSVLAPEYDQMFKSMQLTASGDKLDPPIRQIVMNKARYAKIESATGVPWFVIGIAHYLEAALNFNVHLVNGDPLTARTVHFPQGRPTVGEPPFTWEASAQDALAMGGWTRVQDWSLTRILFEFEKFNGWGYRRSHKINSPYLWNCTSQYTKGAYTRDAVFDPNVVAARCGAAAFLKRMMDRQLVALK